MKTDANGKHHHGHGPLDTASCYRNEAEVGRALQGRRRDSFFLTSKVAPKEMGFEAATVAIDNILSRLQLGYLDLLLIHWPGRSPLKGSVLHKQQTRNKQTTNNKKKKSDDPRNATARIETWRALEQAYAMGKCRAIGVSNFTVRHLEHLLPHCIVRPHVNQVEFHVRLQQWDLLQFCTDQQIHLSAYSPLGCGNVRSHLSFNSTRFHRNNSFLHPFHARNDRFILLSPPTSPSTTCWKNTLNRDSCALLFAPLHRPAPNRLVPFDPPDHHFTRDLPDLRSFSRTLLWPPSPRNLNRVQHRRCWPLSFTMA